MGTKVPVFIIKISSSHNVVRHFSCDSAKTFKGHLYMCHCVWLRLNLAERRFAAYLLRLHGETGSPEEFIVLQFVELSPHIQHS